MALILVCLVLLGIGRYTDYLNPLRVHINVLATPFYWIANIPNQVGEWFDFNVSSRSDLIDENAQLREQVLVQEAKLQKLNALALENNRLRALMNSSSLLQDKILVGELIGISPDPKVHKVIVNKGSNDGAFVGQAVLDAFGLVGQIVSVTFNTAEVLFITDDSHAIPVQINRNSVRTVVEGIGDLYRLRLRYVPSTMDIKAGDLLMSSGLGGRFPPGYPVATVQSVNHDPGKSFATVYARPTAQLNRSRYVLLVFSEAKNEPTEPVKEPAEAVNDSPKTEEP